MAHLDLEEQEQLDQIKHFWKQYGNLITWVLTAVLAAYAGWNGWQYWQSKQAMQASALYDEVERIARSGDLSRLERALGDMKDQYGSTTYAQQAALLAAKAYFDADRLDAAKGALAWVAEKASDEGYRAVARLRLSGILLETKAYDEALKLLNESYPADFVPLVADRRGDVYLAQGKKTEAAAEYRKAYQGLEEGTEYRRLVDAKLAALGGQK